MFEHFTDHAQSVLQLENLEAQRMHHNYLGTEHLLLGLVREPEGHGHRALEKVGVNLKQLRETVAELVGEGDQTDIPDGFHPTVHFRQVMQKAIDLARELKHGHVGTEHLLLALLDEADGVAVQTLQRLSIEPDSVKDEILTMLEQERSAT